MANEHTLVYETMLPVGVTIADGTGIEKGTLLISTDPNTATAVAAANGIVAGVAAYEKIASNGQTSLGIYRGGIFKATASGTITNGDALLTDHTGNKLVSAAGKTSLSGHIVVGNSLESATDGQTFLYILKPQYVNMGSAAGTG